MSAVQCDFSGYEILAEDSTAFAFVDERISHLVSRGSGILIPSIIK